MKHSYRLKQWVTLMVFCLMLPSIYGVAAGLPYQKPGAPVWLTTEPITLLPGELLNQTIELQVPDGQHLLDIQLREPRGLELMGAENRWVIEATGGALEIPVVLRAGDQPGNYAINFLVRAWPNESKQNIDNLRQQPGGLSRVLGVAVIVAGPHIKETYQQKTSTPGALPVRVLGDGRKVRWTEVKQ
ncbi:hypothetical protein [Teredinibacter franksiae]|uniref:hypothetical protein n=1 Tax=Teredinibacter franksiae TaxID=2761453 RepID=UPI00162AAC77|nr:hypothetical protein [Teredinibacter franksiae]